MLMPENKKNFDILLLSEEFKAAIKQQFGNLSLKLELFINQGGIQSGEVKFKIK